MMIYFDLGNKGLASY